MTDTTTVGMSLSFGEMLRRDRQNRAPDVLNTIASLSSDEVFTPPEFANKMLDTLEEAWADDHKGASIWADPDVTFLDPATKSGVFLREITKRLVEGQGNPPEGSDKRKALVDRVLTKQVFAIGMTTLTALIARRSVYCSKDATGKHSVAPSSASPDGNIWFQRTAHTWVGDRCVYCPASKEGYERGDQAETYAYALLHHTDPKSLIVRLFGENMHFDVIVGNPPYQLDDGGAGKSAAPIYHRFVQAAKALQPQYLTMVTPSRWMAGGKGLDEFRAEMLADDRIRSITDFIDSDEAFPGVDIAGGVSYFLWSRDFHGRCSVTTIVRGRKTRPTERRLNEFDVFVRHSDAISILHKVWPGGHDPLKSLSVKVSGRKAFGFATTDRGAPTTEGINTPVTLMSSGGDGYIPRASVTSNAEWIDKWKATVSRAAPAGGRPDRDGRYYGLSSIRVVRPGYVTTEAYPVVSAFDTELEAERMCAYLKSRFVRFLLSLRAANQSVTRSTFAFVPDLPMDRVWTDEELYAKYDVSLDEQAYIESLVRPMVVDSASTQSGEV
ncbi:Eco57I restriction-modification methylase domain-containing protein [Naasia aerilata]|uniref:site-specific DNA-methyltransferase (adenine-specific) n=1 Tax=Naasia aerilata TaxID=1162966 RepID=A0ABM8GFP1_9MICO|nr:Eco57I restriction-modification methylase domain-containing protein [Naasia aerilata]BDZ47172.1 type III restriction endonuclease [Naasia aerilata]